MHIEPDARYRPISTKASDDLTGKRIDVYVLKGVDGRRTDYRTTPAMVKRAVP